MDDMKKVGIICNVPLYNIYKITGFKEKKCNIRYYKIIIGQGLEVGKMGRV
jgi:hypothetical protein